MHFLDVDIIEENFQRFWFSLWNEMDWFLGAYDDEEAAAHAYDLAALKYWGPDTILNFPVNLYLFD